MKTVAFVRGTGIYNDSRSTKEILALAEAGYHVEVLGWNRDGQAYEKCKEAFKSVEGTINFSFFNVCAENGIGLKSINKILKWFKWTKKTLSKIKGLSVVHACDLDAGIASLAFCKKNKIKLIYDIFDYYVDAHHIPSFLKSFVERMEIKAINFAETTIICTEERKEQISKANPKNLIVIHNSPELRDTPQVEEDMDYFYCGAMAGKRLISEILESYETNDNLKLTFAGYGPYGEKALALSEKYENFSYLGALSYSRVLLLEARASVLSAIYEPTIRNHRLCAPNKFYESLALAKPVIVCRGTGIDKIVEENNIGCVIDYDATQFYDALHQLVADPELRKEMGVRARKLYEEKYDWALMKEILLKTYASL